MTFEKIAITSKRGLFITSKYTVMSNVVHFVGVIENDMAI